MLQIGPRVVWSILKRIKKKDSFLLFRFYKTDLPYKNNFFDGVIAIQVFDHILKDDAKKLLKEVSRVSKRAQ